MKTYELSAKVQSLVEKSFQSHPPTQDQAPRLEAINERLLQMSRYLCGLTPESAEQTLMIRSLKEAQFWATEAISKNEA